MTTPYNALQIPPSAQQQGGLEVLRAGVVNGGLHVTLRRAFDDPKAWGVLLADVARQVAAVYSQQDQKEAANILAGIHEAFAEHMALPGNESTIAPIEKP
jgi:hypothetical protein